MPMSLDKLRRFAELNLCANCYQTYLALIQPNVKSMVFNSLDDWKSMELDINQMIMRLKGVFKTEIVVLSFEEHEEDSVKDAVDVKKFRQIEKMGFKGKIDYLQRKGFLQSSTYELLNHARKIRNKHIHSDPLIGSISEKDLELFRHTAYIVFLISYPMIWKESNEIIQSRVEQAEVVAEKFLNAYVRNQTRKTFKPASSPFK